MKRKKKQLVLLKKKMDEFQDTALRKKKPDMEECIFT